MRYSNAPPIPYITFATSKEIDYEVPAGLSPEQRQPFENIYIMDSKSILVVGATGRTGSEVIRQLCDHSSQPRVTAFCRDPVKLDAIDGDLKLKCDDVVQGDARIADDLERAIEQSCADIIIMCIGSGDNLTPTDVRSASAEALVSVLEKPKYRHVKVLVVSCVGAGCSRIDIGLFGVGKIFELLLYFVLKDHTKQEEIFRSSIGDRTVIVRPTGLTEHRATGKIKQFGDLEVSPTMYTDRSDLAEWIVEEVCGEVRLFGDKIANITSTS